MKAMIRVVAIAAALQLAGCAAPSVDEGQEPAGSGDRNPRCKDTGYVDLNMDQTGPYLTLARSFESNAPEVGIQIHSIRNESNYWATQCPLRLDQRLPGPTDGICVQERILGRGASMRITEVDSGGLRLHLRGTRRGDAATDLKPANPAGPTGNAIPWLSGSIAFSGHDPIDVYVMLQDTRQSTPRDHKAYWVEFHRINETDPHCRAHRPEMALCVADDPREACSAPVLLSSAELGPTQADGGGGSEPPYDP